MKLSNTTRFFKSGSVALFAAVALMSQSSMADTLLYAGGSNETGFYNLDEDSTTDQNDLKSSDAAYLFTSADTYYQKMADAAGVSLETYMEGVNDGTYDTFGSSTTISLGYFGTMVSDLTVDADAAHYTMAAGSSGYGRYWYLKAGTGGTTNLNINQDFTIDMSPCTQSSANSTDLIMDASLVATVAANKSLYVSAQFKSSADQTITIQGGGTMVYQNINKNAATTEATQSDWIITGGSTLDLSQSVGGSSHIALTADRLDKTLGTGSVKLDGGNIKLIEGSTLNNTLEINTSAVNSLAGAGAITLAGELVMSGDFTQSLDLKGSTIVLGEGFTIDLTGTELATLVNDGALVNYNLLEGAASIDASAITDLNSILVGLTGDDYEVSVQNGSLVLAANNIPEPSTATLSLLALAGLCARRRRKA